MRSIKARFNQQERTNPNVGAYINLQRAVRGQRFMREPLQKAFNELVPKADYSLAEKKGLIDWLELVSKTPKSKKLAR